MGNVEPNEQHVAEAIEWLVLFEAGTQSLEDQRAFARWQKHPAHQIAWQRLGRASRHFDPVHGLSGQQAMRSVQSADQLIQSKRKTLKILLSIGGVGVLAAGTGGAGLSLGSQPLYDRLMADVTTAIGEQKRQVLLDGSSMMLNTQSGIDIDFDATPELSLRYGDVYIRQSGSARLRVDRHLISPSNQSSFVVSYRDAICQVHVLKGSLRCWMNGVMYELQAHQSLRHQNGRTQRAVTNLNALSWRQGILTAERMTLGQFLQELNRYRPGYLSCSDEIAPLVLTGSFPIKNTDAILANVCRTLPIKQQRISPYWVRLTSV
ncbi:DUF4880 domain-containing protein [Neptunomonas phycophila]|uniref:DUF4880 domain-containing protein n=1 Tax=Neptunomonas phycophila TaxID=1572645 RepID=UPI000948AEA4|nr:DUF4880 domain-containing protein [Neptunomonas phycophila]